MNCQICCSWLCFWCDIGLPSYIFINDILNWSFGVLLQMSPPVFLLHFPIFSTSFSAPANLMYSLTLPKCLVLGLSLYQNWPPDTLLKTESRTFVLCFSTYAHCVTRSKHMRVLSWWRYPWIQFFLQILPDNIKLATVLSLFPLFSNWNRLWAFVQTKVAS